MLVVDDWRLMDNGEIQPSFGNFHDAMMAGRLGQYITLNSQDTFDLKVKTNERLRLRIVNTANSRIFRFRIADHVTRLMAVDGQPCPPEIVPDGVLRLGARQPRRPVPRRHAETGRQRTDPGRRPARRMARPWPHRL